MRQSLAAELGSSPAAEPTEAHYLSECDVGRQAGHGVMLGVSEK